MNKIEKIVIYVFLAAILLVGVIGLNHSQGKIGGASVNDTTYFPGTLQTDNFTAAGQTVTGVSAFVGTTTITGVTTLGNGNVVSVNGATSTLKIGNTASGIAAGCLVLGDSGGATSSPVYITATGATLTATTTKPATCR